MILKALPVLLISTTIAFAQQAPADMGAAPAQAAPAQTQTKTLQAAAVDATLKTAIDSKKAKQGDEIMAAVAADTALPDGTKLAKGSTLVGHVTAATPFDKKSKTPATVTIAFNEVKGKDGSSTPIMSMVRGLKPSPAAQMNMATGGSDANATGDTSAAPEANAGAGMLNGAVQTAIPNVMLAPPPDNTASGTVASTKDNLHIDSGSDILLAVAATPHP